MPLTYNQAQILLGEQLQGQGRQQTQEAQFQPGTTNTVPPSSGASPSPSSGAKLILEIAKIYTNKQKWDGTNSSFKHKLTIFLDICQHVKLLEGALIKAFLTMLKGLAQDHFYTNQLSKCLYTKAYDNLWNFFKSPSYYH